VNTPAHRRDPVADLITALHAVEADAVGRRAGHQGEIPCPICKTGTLQYQTSSRRARRDGHGACSTPGCVWWMA
jgi:hypothetical protein